MDIDSEEFKRRKRIKMMKKQRSYIYLTIVPLTYSMELKFQTTPIENSNQTPDPGDGGDALQHTWSHDVM